MAASRKRLPMILVTAVLAATASVPERAQRWLLNPVFGSDVGTHDVVVGFSPALCAGDLPPAELLALADWPLDAAGIGCRRRTAADIIAAYSDEEPAAREEAVVVAAIEAPAAVEFEPLAPANDAPAALPPPTPAPRGQEPVLFSGALVDDDTLDGLRGGFETPGGLVMSFGIERLVYINGALTSMTRLNVADLGSLSGSGIDPAQLSAVGSTLAVIQNGPNNTFVSDALADGAFATAFATVIQNSLNNQRIQAVTTINATVNSLDMMRASRLGESLRSAASGAMIR
ncbi:hypothetical protein [Azoarcus sp. KH32C]|uniref:hypothetical protein n=1 Tax=Azoarcus sp. KH32C TaxID=748247 RepID=UPI000238658D|nr:hypothetical protein [Azoarcus sp. KH32C]BAL22568.1 hypothetical protein AZKH_0222 [Azoarcus sp. KH32C]